MNVMAAIPEVVRASSEAIKGKADTAKPKSKGTGSFADVLNAIDKPESLKGENTQKVAQQTDDSQPLYQEYEVNSFFGGPLAIPAALAVSPQTNSQAGNTSTALAIAEETALCKGQAGPKVLDDTIKIVPLIPMDSTTALAQATTGQEQQKQLHSPGAMQQINVETVALIESPALNQKDQGDGLNEFVNIKPELYQEGQNKNIGEMIGNVQKDIKNAQEVAAKNIYHISNVSAKSYEDEPLKPLSDKAAYHQILVASKIEAGNSLQTDEIQQPLDPAVKDDKTSQVPIITESSSENTSQFNNGFLTSEPILNAKNPAESTTNSPVSSFQQVLNQFNKPDQVTEVSGQELTQPLRDNNNIVNQIVEHARLIKSPEASEMVIKLKPEHLGELTLKVAVDNGVVSASFHSNNSEVRGIIEASVQQLRQEMAQQGLKVEYVGVYAGLGQPFSNGQGEANRQQAWRQQLAKKQAGNQFSSEKLETIESIAGSLSDSGVDYRI